MFNLLQALFSPVEENDTCYVTEKRAAACSVTFLNFTEPVNAKKNKTLQGWVYFIT